MARRSVVKVEATSASRAAAALVVALAGCSGPKTPPVSDLPVSFDFVERASLAEVSHEVPFLNFGTPQARPFLRDGWSSDETAGDGETYVWSDGPLSSIRIFLSRPRPLRMTFRCAVLAPAGLPPMRIEFRLNGRPLGEQRLESGLGDYHIQLPREATVRGTNLLELVYAYTYRPGAADPRELAVAWNYLRFDGVRGTGGPPPLRADDSTKTLHVPVGTSVAYFVDLPDDAVLDLSRVELPAAPAVRLSVAVERDGAPRRVLTSIETSGVVEPLPFGALGPGVARVAFAAVPVAHDASLPADAAVRLVAPVIRAGSPRRLPGTGLGTSTARLEACKPSRPNVLVYLVDTLRADRLGVYGYPRETSPHIDALARDGIVFRHAMAQAPWTKASVASLFTGYSPPAHGAEDRNDGLASEAPTLAERFREAGYRTGMFYANGWVGSEFGMTRGFDQEVFLSNEPSSELHSAFLSWLDGLDPSTPFLAYVHSVDPHSPYEPPERQRDAFVSRPLASEMGSLAWMRKLHDGHIAVTPELVQGLSELYDAEIAFNDETFGALVEALEDRGQYDDLFIVFLSDHGEEFFEHGKFGHGVNLYRPTLSIPLIVKLPGSCGVAGGEVTTPASHPDVLPTLLDYLGGEPPADTDGESLMPLLFGGPELPGRHVLSFMNVDGMRAEGIATNDAKLIRRPGQDGFLLELYVGSDLPSESDDVSADYPIREHYLGTRIDWYRSRVTERSSIRTEIDEDLARELRALGYLQ